MFQRYLIPITFLKWQNLRKTSAGRAGSDLTAVEYFAGSFIHTHRAGTVNGIKDFILLFVCRD